MTKQLRLLALLGLVVLAFSIGPTGAAAQAPLYSVWLVESSQFKDVPSGAFMPDRVFVPGSSSPMNNQAFMQLPVNVGVIKGGKDIVVVGNGWRPEMPLRPWCRRPTRNGPRCCRFACACARHDGSLS